MSDAPRMDAAEGCYDEHGNKTEVYEVGCTLERELALNAAMLARQCDLARTAEADAERAKSERNRIAADTRGEWAGKIAAVAAERDDALRRCGQIDGAKPCGVCGTPVAASWPNVICDTCRERLQARGPMEFDSGVDAERDRVAVEGEPKTRKGAAE